MTGADVYQPSRGLAAKVRRRVVRRMHGRTVPLRLARPTVSFTFDDVPLSVARNALPVLEARSWPATLYVATGLLGGRTHFGRMMDADDVEAAARAGHEIAAHSHAHTDYAQGDWRGEERQSDAAWAALGHSRPTAFAWPYGEASAAAKGALKARYSSLRGIGGGLHIGRVDLHQLGAMALFSDRVERVVRAVESLGDRPGWLILFTHDVEATPTPWGCTPGEFCRVVEAVEAMGADVRTVSDVVEDVVGDLVEAPA